MKGCFAFLLVCLLLLVLAACGEVPTAAPEKAPTPTPALTPTIGVDVERFAALKARVESLRAQGRDVAYLDQIVADIEHWIAAGEPAGANLQIAYLESTLPDFEAGRWPTARPTPVLPPAPGATLVPEAGGAMLFQEDFSNPTALATWESAFLMADSNNNALWELRQNALYLNDNGGGDLVGIICVTGQDWSDYVYSVDIYPGGSMEVGVIFRYQARDPYYLRSRPSDFYRFRFVEESDNSDRPTRFLERVHDGQATILAQAEGPGYQVRHWYNVQVVADGAKLTVYLDGQVILQAKDDTLLHGQVGVFALSIGSAYFDNIQVAAIR